MSTALAGLPILVALLALLRWRPAPAALLALGAAVVLVPVAFPMPWAELGAGVLSGVPTLVEVAGILAGGLLLARVLDAVGAQEAMASWLTRCGVTPVRTVLLVTLGLTPFAEAVTGFGVGAVIAVPILLRLGLGPARAAVVALLGLHLVPWGGMAVGTLVAADLGGVGVNELGLASVALNAPVALVAAGAAVLVLRSGRLSRRDVPEIVLTVLAQHGLVLLMQVLLGTVLAGASATALLLVVLVLRARWADGADVRPDVAMRRAFLAYAVLLGGLVLTRALTGRLVGSDGGATGGVAVDVLTSPATWMLAAAVVGWLTRDRAGRPEANGIAVVASAVRAWVPVAVTTLGFLLLGLVMATAGMSADLASAAAEHLGLGYLVVGPVLAALGGYLTGSNAGSASMFAGSASAAAANLGSSSVAVLAAQGVAASALTAASPARVALVVAAAGAGGRASTGAPVTRPVLVTTGAATVLVALLSLLTAR